MSNLPAIPGSPPATAGVPAMSVNDLMAVAKQVAASRLFPGVQSEQAAFTLMMLCQAEGLHPISALRRYHIIQGRPSMRSDAMQAEFQRQGGVVRWVESSNDVCIAQFLHPVHAPEPGLTVTVRLAELAKAGVTESNPNYKKWPRQMLRARAISEGVRAVLPGVVVGIYSDVEVEDMAADRPHHAPAQPAAIDVTPPPSAGPSLGSVLDDAASWANDELLKLASSYGQTVEDGDMLTAIDLHAWTLGECVRRGMIPAKQANGKATAAGYREQQLENLLATQPAVIRSIITGFGRSFLADAKEKMLAQAGVGDAAEAALAN